VFDFIDFKFEFILGGCFVLILESLDKQKWVFKKAGLNPNVFRKDSAQRGKDQVHCAKVCCGKSTC